jgi:hypothetical protein
MDLETENCLFVEETRRLRLRLQEDKEGVLAYSPKPGSEFIFSRGVALMIDYLNLHLHHF